MPGPTVYGSGPSVDEDDAHPNGHVPPIDEDDTADEEREEPEYDYANLFSAPNYSTFIKTPPNSKAMEYEKRLASMMKAGMIVSLNNGQFPDAATFLKHGPGFAKAWGNLAAEDAKVAGIVNMLTAPDSPWVTAVLVAVPFIAQLARNHREQVDLAGQTWRERRTARKAAKSRGERVPNATPPITVRIFKRRITLPIRFRIKLPSLTSLISGFSGSTQRPDAIAWEVFHDPAVVKALHKMGIFPRGEAPNEDEAAA